MSATILFLLARDTPVQTMKLAGVRRYAASREWKVVAVGKDDSAPERIRELFSRHRPIGCVVDCCGNENPLRPSIFRNIPAVWLDAPYHARGAIGSHSVSVDEEAVASTALRELTANFPKSLATVEFQFEPYQRRQRWSRDRAQAFCELAEGTGLPCAVFETHERESPEARAARLAGWLLKLPRPCGVFAVNDGTAWQVRAACRAARLAIPRDIAIVGVDNDPELCEDDSPALSSIQVDFERMGHVAARMLGERMSAEGNVSGNAGLNRLSGEAALNGVDGSGKAVSISPMLVIRRRSTGGRGRQESLILKAVEMIRREAADGLTAGDLAARFPGSRRHFERRFREAMGHSVFDEILHVRIEKAMALLSRRDIAIGAIYFQCGFGSESDLRTHFHKLTGISLRQWRKDHSD